MTDLTHDMTDMMPRRGLFGRFAGAMVLALAGFATTPVRAESAATPSDGPDWPGVLKGRHRQVVDAYDVNAGFPLAFAYSFLVPHGPPSASSVVNVDPRMATDAGPIRGCALAAQAILSSRRQFRTATQSIALRLK